MEIGSDWKEEQNTSEQAIIKECQGEWIAKLLSLMLIKLKW